MKHTTLAGAKQQLDNAAHRIALQMARRFYWFHHETKKQTGKMPKTRFSYEKIPPSPTTSPRYKKEFRQFSTSETAYNAYCHYYNRLAKQPGYIAYQDHTHLTKHIENLGTDDKYLQNVLHGPTPKSAEENGGYVDLKHMHQIERHDQSQAAEYAFFVYQHSLKYPQVAEDVKLLADDKKNVLLRNKQMQDQQIAAENIACDFRRDYLDTLHRQYTFRAPLSEDFEFSREMQQRQFDQQLDTQSFKSAWNVGFKLFSVFAAATALVTYGAAYSCSAIKHAQSKDSWQHRHAAQHETAKNWAQGASRIVRTIGAMMFFTFAVIPAMVIHHRTRRLSLSQDTITTRLYNMFHTVTNDKGKIKPEQQYNVIHFINDILHSYHGNPLTQSKSSKQLIAQLKSEKLPLEEKLQAVIGYLTATHSVKHKRSIKSLFWSRDSQFLSADSELGHNAGKNLFNTIQQALLNCSLTPRAVASQRNKQVRFAPAVSYRTF
ncbi:MAG: hypothetical protein P1U63_01475 [Coxiellaceae bacterium]|nr:hypothetical protein [Coxiellaceae bacterium]